MNNKQSTSSSHVIKNEHTQQIAAVQSSIHVLTLLVLRIREYIGSYTTANTYQINWIHSYDHRDHMGHWQSKENMSSYQHVTHSKTSISSISDSDM